MPNRDEIKGKAKEARGSVEQKAGEWTGDRDREAEGQAKRTEDGSRTRTEVKRETGERVEEAGKKLKR